MIRRPCVRGSPPQAEILGITQRIFVIFSVKIASVIPAGDGFYEERDQYQLRKAQNFLGAFGAGGFSASRLPAPQCLTSSTTEKTPPDLSDWQITRGGFLCEGGFLLPNSPDYSSFQSEKILDPKNEKFSREPHEILKTRKMILTGRNEI